MFGDVMLDLETLGKAPGCIVLSIGAVAFDPARGLGEQFHVILNIADSERLGLVADPTTREWWDAQSREAQETLRQAEEAGLTVHSALARFNQFIEVHTAGPDVVRVWGNGAGFDQPILRGVYEAADVAEVTPWCWWNDRCFRTLKGLAPEIEMQRHGTHHNALDDALTQAKHAILVMQRLRINVSTL